MISTKFTNHKNAQATINYYDNGRITLQSYTATVAEIENDWLTIHGLYSATTRKHLSWFMKMLGLTYQDAKACYENNLTMNITTGEVVSCKG